MRLPYPGVVVARRRRIWAPLLIGTRLADFTVMPDVSEFRLRILMQSSASSFAISNVVGYTWSTAGTPPSG